MSDIIPLPIAPPPGVVVTETNSVVAGRWIQPFDKIRFVHGRPQKLGGNVRLTSSAMTGVPRATHAWRDFDQNQYVAAGTDSKLYAFDSSYVKTDITPFSSTGSLGANPFTTVSGSAIVTVTHTLHGRAAGDVEIFAGATTFNGVTMNGTFTVVNVVSANSYMVTAATTASASGSGGGGAVTFQYEIGVGTNLGAFGLGYGVGGYGLGTYGSAHGSSTIVIEPRIWSLDNFGVVLLASYNNGSLWSFDPTQSLPWGRAVSTFGGVPMNSPTDIRAMFVTPERFVFALRDAMVVQACSQGDPTDWTPSISNTAFSRTLQIGAKLVGGRVLAPFISMVWSDAACYLFQYTGDSFIYKSSLAGRDCGLISPNGAVTVDGIAYWMGADNFYFYNGSVSPLANVEDIRKYVFDSIPSSLAFQCNAKYIPKYHEIWFSYPTTGAINPTNYVIYHINDQCWSPGTEDFYSSAGVTAGRASGTHLTQGDTSPIMAGTDGYLYNHDPVGDTFNDNGTPQTWTLTLAPITKSEGTQNLDVEGVRWDFLEQNGDISATVTTYNELTDPAPMDQQTKAVTDTERGMTDYRVGGRFIGCTLTSSDLNNYMRMGKSVAYVRPSARRR